MNRPLIGVTTSEVRRGSSTHPLPEGDPPQPELDLFELSVARRADALELPVLGVCRGAQTLDVARGGTLIQHLPAVTDGTVEHRQAVSGWLTSHPVEIAPDSRLARIVGRDRLDVHSFHHQAAGRIGEGLRPVAWAPDGVVEAIEGGSHAAGGLLLGVQWHAGTLTEIPQHLALFEALVEATASDRSAGDLVA